jgi:hypothetical protein
MDIYNKGIDNRIDISYYNLKEYIIEEIYNNRIDNIIEWIYIIKV